MSMMFHDGHKPDDCDVFVQDGNLFRLFHTYQPYAHIEIVQAEDEALSLKRMMWGSVVSGVARRRRDRSKHAQWPPFFGFTAVRRMFR